MMEMLEAGKEENIAPIDFDYEDKHDHTVYFVRKTMITICAQAG